MDKILGVAIGIATVCLIFSIVASHVQEIWALFSAKRAKTLEAALENMLSDADLSTAFFEHPLIQAISFSRIGGDATSGKASAQARPSFISSDLFSKVLQSALVSTKNLQAKEFPSIVTALPDSAVKCRLATHADPGIESDVKVCNAAVEKWYDDAMDRINGLYKRNTQVALIFLGLFLALLCNVNLLRVAGTFWPSAAAQDEVNAVAQMYGCKDGNDCSALNYVKARADLANNLKLVPFGYNDFNLLENWANVKGDMASGWHVAI
jgi:hypothetical protein